MSDVIVSAVVERLKSLIEEQARYHINLVRGAEKEVLNLSKELEAVRDREKVILNLYKELEAVRDVLDDAEKKQFKDKSVKNWLVRLEETSFEMDDVLDEWNYAILKCQMEFDRSFATSKVWSFIPLCSCLVLKEAFKEVSLRHGISKKKIDVIEKLDEVLKQNERYQLTISQPNSDPSPNSWSDKSTSFANLDVIHGRDSDRDFLVTKLMSRREELGVQVVSIVGVGGLGKTSLAQFVYNNSQVENSFDLRIWICVSDPFDLVSIAKGILESMKKGNPSNTTQLDVLLRDVQESIQGKRFLLVLDDVWIEDSKKWETLKTSLKCGGAGSKILVTTRNQNVAEIMDTMKEDIHHLGKLTNEECWRLLCNKAFSGRNREKFEAFKDMSEGIAEKCKGLPLAAKVLGSLLRTKSSLEEWENVLNSEIWQLEQAELELFPHLLLSYNELSPMHKRCFSYCAIFPKDSYIIVEDLIGKWMAVGYLGSNTSDMELKGRECFEILAMRSLFQDFNKDDFDEEIVSCKMHDIVHDFALSIRKSGRLNEGRLNNTTCGACDPLLISKANEFRSLFPGCFDDIRRCDCLKRLRVLGVPKREYLQSFPQGMENLIHLRWLKLDGNKLSGENLKTIFQLYYLQILLMKNCKIEVIPGEIGNLIRLRRLDLSFNEDLKELPESMGRLKQLRSLNVENCARLVRLPDEMYRLENLGHDLTFGVNGLNSLGFLRDMWHLRGTLRMKIRLADGYQRDVVKTAREARLIDKGHIKRLVIEFEDETKGASECSLDLFEALEPHRKLQSLEIWSYKGSRLPAWIVPAGQGLKHLRELRIMNCDYIWSLPPLAKLHLLEEIEMFSMSGLEYVERGFLAITAAGAVAFPRLKILTFRRCPNWKEWEDITAEEEESADLVLMPCLTRLTLKLCTGLRELPHRLLRNMRSLEVLDISYSEKLEQRYGRMDSSTGKSLFGEARFVIERR